MAQMTNEEVYDFWVMAKRINPAITLAQAARIGSANAR